MTDGFLHGLIHQHDWRIAAFATLICIFSLGVAMLLFDRARRLSPRARRPYLLSAPLVGGLGVWATHFIAMLSYDAGATVRYDAFLTGVSLVVVVLSFCAAMRLHLTGQDTVWRRHASLAAALLMALSVAAMHFIGMSALRMEGLVLTWNAPLVLMAVGGGVALFAASAALPLTSPMPRLALSTALMVCGICWLHFVAMGAMTLSPAPEVFLPAQTTSQTLIALWAALGVVLTVIIAAFFVGMMWWSRRSALGQVLEAINAMPDGVSVYDADDRLILWNRRFLEIYPHLEGQLKPGVTFQTLIRQTLANGIVPEALGCEDAWIEQRMATHRRIAEPRELQVADRWVKIQDRPTTGGGVVTLYTDITDQRRNADALAEARDAADAANRAKSRFLANMSHEIRTPLNGLIGVAQALSRTELTPQQREMLELIQSSGRALKSLLSDILDLARVESGRLELKEEAFDLAETVDEAAMLYAEAARQKGLQFIVEVAPEAQIWAFGDALRLKQVLTNLVSNAVKFTRSGFVSLTVDAVPAEAPHTLRFVVQDTGIGFDAHAQERLFNRFEQADGDISRHYGGSGLGLAICREMAAMMGGDIGCESQPGAGSAFILTLPLKTAEPPDPVAASPAPPAPDEAPGNRLRVLAADDHPTNRRVVELILDPGQFDLVSVENGAEAVEACRAERFDLVLMDMQMPVMDGLTAVQEIRLHEAAHGLVRTPLVMLTANALPEHLEKALAAGADRHMAKPFSVEALLAMVAELTAKTPQAANAAA
ncbi:ATP-binding protein [Brevundimonas diminuta]|uniref:ATP-binding protein n=1 Tax=Brevundimonas diminuta TaxID=293 RepID=UPI003CFEA4FA